MKPPVIDDGKIADLAKRSKELQDRLVALRERKAIADRELSSAECELRNLMADFTRASKPLIDKTVLEMIHA